ncbi:GNAT family N-acetyltransferase [Geodermatophilus sabuli]|uniref:GNAT family N-acetyltransferase n=2 Tax=Geodermatophilus sabuli TaxID=1564158 RepID=A0A7K3W667_9ACTN|nr:GNAT family N-acetyltransferase [Geodermatophilus sabuli]
MRRRPVAGVGERAEVGERLTRLVGTQSAWTTVVWSDLSEADADRVIAAEVARSEGPLEWKLYSHDRPADLPDRLRAAGLRPEPAETVMVADLADLQLPVPTPGGVRLTTVEDDAGVEAMTDVHRGAFGTVHAGSGTAVRAALQLHPRPIEAVVAWAGDVPVSAGRVEFHEGTGFASLWGGGTLPAWRGRGVFRALVGHRAVLARDRGFRWLQVDALPASRPILQRMGFHPVAETTPWVREPRSR